MARAIAYAIGINAQREIAAGATARSSGAIAVDCRGARRSSEAAQRDAEGEGVTTRHAHPVPGDSSGTPDTQNIATRRLTGRVP